MWTDFEDKLKARIPIDFSYIAADYEDDNDKPFETNRKVVKDAIDEARDEMKLQKIAMVQADVIGHSMGGILSRIRTGGDQWPNREPYVTDQNFQRGDIHKLITLDSPHFGGYLADFALKMYSDLPSGVRDAYYAALVSRNMDIFEGAVSDLTTFSYEIEKLNDISPQSNVKCRAIVGALSSFFWSPNLPDFLGDFASVAVTYLAFTQYNSLPLIYNSDMVVSFDSQVGGIDPLAVSVYPHVHTFATTDQVADETVDLLNEKYNSFQFADGFPTGLYP